MTPTVGSRDDLANDWLNTSASQQLQGHDVAKPFPKRSDLRRAEARAANRRGADRRPPGSRPPGGAAGRTGPPALASSGRVAEPGRRPHTGTAASAWTPIAVAPTAAVLPIRQTSSETRPAGIDLRVPRRTGRDAFHRTSSAGAPLPLAVPAYEGVVDLLDCDPEAPPPMAPRALAAPVKPALDPAEWGLDLEATPASGRRRGVHDDVAPDSRRPKSPPTSSFPARLFGRGKASAARLLVLALVVGAEGVAVSSMAGHARIAPADPSTTGISAYQVATLSARTDQAKPAADTGAEQQNATLLAAEEALTAAQDEASRAKVTASLQQAKAAADRVKAAADRRARAMRNAQRDPRSVARIMALERGWGADQFSCLNLLWNRESQWNYRAQNPGSSAYGIPQALNGQMASAGADWRTNPVTQIKWGLDYIGDRYGTPCGAWAHSESQGWY